MNTTRNTEKSFLIFQSGGGLDKKLKGQIVKVIGKKKKTLGDKCCEGERDNLGCEKVDI